MNQEEKEWTNEQRKQWMNLPDISKERKEEKCYNCNGLDCDYYICVKTNKIYYCDCYKQCEFCKRILSYEYLEKCKGCEEPIILEYTSTQAKNTSNLKWDEIRNGWDIDGSCCKECYVYNKVPHEYCLESCYESYKNKEYKE